MLGSLCRESLFGRGELGFQSNLLRTRLRLQRTAEHAAEVLARQFVFDHGAADAVARRRVRDAHEARRVEALAGGERHAGAAIGLKLHQPLGGEVAVRRTMIEQLPIAQGWGVEIGMLLDVARSLGSGIDQHASEEIAPMPIPDSTKAIPGRLGGAS